LYRPIWIKAGTGGRQDREKAREPRMDAERKRGESV